MFVWREGRVGSRDLELGLLEFDGPRASFPMIFIRVGIGRVGYAGLWSNGKDEACGGDVFPGDDGEGRESGWVEDLV